MLHLKNGEKGKMRDEVLDQLFRDDKRPVEQMYAEIGRLVNKSRSAIVKWRYGYNNPSDIETVEILAEYFGVNADALVESMPFEIQNVTNGGVNDAEELDLDDNTVENMEDVEDGIMTWAEIRAEVKKRPILRIYLEEMLNLTLDVKLSFIEKQRLFTFKKDGSNELQKALSMFLREINEGVISDWREAGDWFCGVRQKCIIRRKAKFLGVNLIYFIAYLRYVELYRMNIKDIASLFFGGANLKSDFVKKINAIFAWREKELLDYELPITNIENARYFCPYSMRDTIDAQSTVVPLFITPQFEDGFSRTLEMYHFIKEHNLTNYTTAKLFTDDTLRTIASMVHNKHNCVILMFDDRYGNDMLLKEWVEAYAVEHNVRICYLNPVRIFEEA